jgi:hypothetical protein
MSLKSELCLKRKIYIFAQTASRAIDYMQSHELLRPGEWRDPRVVIVTRHEQLEGVHEAADVHFFFLDGWRQGKSPEFLHYLWNRLPNVMNRESYRP